MAAARCVFAATVIVIAATLLAGCGDEDTTTVVNETTTTVVDSSTSGSSSTTSPTDSTSTDGSGGTSAPLDLKAFQSPTGNIACVMTGELARCDIAERDWDPPNRPPSCQFDYGQGIELHSTGTAQFVCAGDTTINPEAPTLEYGASSHVGLITCSSTEAGMSCANESGGSFTISRQGYDLG